MDNIVKNEKKIKSKSFRESAIEYGQRGLPVVPLHIRSKKPKEEEKWHHRTLTKPEAIAATWEHDNDLNVGIKLGKNSVIDLECDSDEAEREYNALWEGQPPTVPTYKGKRGLHRLFRWREGFPANKSNFHCKAIEVRFGNDKAAQSVFPPSIHPSGIRYEWVIPFDQAQPGEIPDSILDKLIAGWKAGIKKPERIAAPEIDDDDLPPIEDRVAEFNRKLAKTPGAQQGKGSGADPYCFGLAIEAVWGFALPEEEATDCLYDWGQREDQLDEGGAHYPWSHAEIRHKVRDALNVEYAGSKGDKLTDWQLWRDEREVEGIIKAAEITIKEKTSPDPFQDCKTLHDEAAKKKTEKKSPSRKILTIAEFVAQPPPSWLVDQIIPQDSLSILWGPSGHGKSFVLTDMSLRVATGLPFLGEHKTKQGNVLLIVAEGQAGARKRIQRWFEYHDLPYATNVGILPHIFDLIKKEEIQELLTLIDGFQRPNLIAIDPLTNMLESENDEVQMGTLVKVAGLLRAHYHCTVAMVHHTGWKEDREIGSSKLRRGADTMISIRKPGGYEAPILDGLIMQCKKQKDFEPFHAFGVHCRKVGYGDESSIVLTDKYNVMDEKDIEREMKAEIKLYDVLQYLPTDPEQAITRQDLVTLAGLGHMAVRSIIKDSLFVVETGKGLKNLPYRYYLSPKGVAFVDRQRGIRLANNGVS